MAKKTNRKLGLKKETLRQLSSEELLRVAGGFVSSAICEAAGGSGRCGSTDYSIIGYDSLTRAVYSYR